MANPILDNGTASPQSIYESFAPGGLNGVNGGYHPIGTRGRLGERVFYYASHSLSTTLALGSIMGNAANVANDQNRTITATAGSFTMTLTSGGTVNANTYAEGYVLFDHGTGLNQYYRIKSHPADASNVVTLTLYDPIVTTVSSSPTGGLQKNLFADVVVFPGNGQAAVCVGVPAVTIPAGNTNQQYYWIQTQGPAALSLEGTAVLPTVGMAIVPATDATASAGQGKAAVETGTTADTVPLIGYVLIPPGADEDAGLVDLRIRG